MNKAEYWQALVRKNPGFKDDATTIRIKVSSLKAIALQAFDKGESHAKDAVANPYNKAMGGDDLFGGIFKRK